MNKMTTLNTTTAVQQIRSISPDGYEADLPFQNQHYPLKLLHLLSPEVIPGGQQQIKGAVPGMYAGPLGDEQVLFRSFTYQLVGFTLTHPEFLPDQKAPIHDHGERLPREAVFHYVREGYPRSGFYLPNGNEVVPTITALMLVDYGGRQHPSALRFSHSAFKRGRELYGRSGRLKAVVDGEPVRGCHLGKYEMTAVTETKGGKTYLVPKPTLLGVVGEPAGPTLPEYRFADQLRRAFKQGEDWTLLEPPAPPAETKVIEAEPPPADDDPGMVPERVVVDASVEEIIDD
jgi:hypothetical protein